MKKNYSFLLLFTIEILLSLFVSCSNPNNSTPPEWSDVTEKSDLIGTWKAEFYASGAHDTNTLYIGSNYAGFLKTEEDYSDATEEYQNQIPTVVNYLESNGYTYTNNSTEKKLTVIINLSATDLDDFIRESKMQINSSKTKIKMTSNGNTAEYVKQ